MKKQKLKDLAYKLHISKDFGIPIGIIITIFVMAYHSSLAGILAGMFSTVIFSSIMEYYYYKKYGLYQEYMIEKRTKKTKRRWETFFQKRRA